MKISKTKNKTSSSKNLVTATFSTASDEALVSVLQNLPVGVVIFTISKILFLNKAAVKIFKPNKSLEKTITNHSIFEFILPEFKQRVKDNSLKIFEGQEFVPFELKIKNAKNEIVDIEVKSNAIVFNGQQAIQTIFTDVSERVMVKEELSKANRNLELITENANDLIYFYTYLPKPKYIYISPSIKNMLGYSAKDFYENGNLANSLVLDKKGYQAFEAILAKKQKNNTLKYTSNKFQYKTKSGKLVWLEDNYSPIYDDNGKIKFILGISRDITKEKVYQLELEQKWNNYKNLLDTSPIGIFIHEGYCIYCNKTAAHILEEKDPAKIIGKDLMQFLMPEQRERAIDRMKRAIKGEEMPDMPYHIKTVKGNIIEVDLKTVPFIYDGKPCVQTVITNLSAEKKLSKEKLRAEVAEETNKKLTQEINYRKKIQHELVTQTTKYEAIFNNTSHLIWSVNKDLKITSFNKNYYDYIKRIFNINLKVGNSINDFKSKEEQNVNVDFWIEKYHSIFKNKKDNTVEFFEIQNTDLEGKKHYREIYLHPIRGSKAEIIEIAIIAHDVTDRRLNEQKIIEQSAKLQAIFESGKQLIWTVDKNYFFTSFNKNFFDEMFDVYGVKPTIGDKIFKPQKTKTGIDFHNFWIEKYNEVFITGNGIEFTTEQIDKNNNKFFRQIFLHPILKNGLIEEISCISNDVTELRHLQNQSINQAAKLTSIFESSSHLIWSVDKDFKLTSFNKNFSDAFKVYNNSEIKLNTQIHTLLPKRLQANYKAYWYERYQKVLDGVNLQPETLYLELNGKINITETFFNPIKNINNEIIEVACISHDITEARRIEQQTLEQSAKLKAIFESSSHLIWTVDKDFKATSFNKNFSNSFKVYNGVEPELNIQLHKLLPKRNQAQYKAYWYEIYKKVFDGNSLKLERFQPEPNGELNVKEIYLNPVRNINNEIIEVACLAHDITENKRFEQQIVEQSAKLKAIFESGDQLMWTISKDLKLSSFNQNYANSIFDLYGYYPEVGKTMRSGKSADHHTFWDEKYELAFQGKQVEFISERTLLNGTKVIRQIILYPIKDANNNVLEISGIGFDITENKKNEERITQSLKEKDVLLKEVHHRVKNNMQVISSILNLQSSYVRDAYALNLLKECQNRIKSMAFIHESLYQTKNFESVNFSEYVTTLSKNLVHTYSINTKKIKLILTLDNLFLSLDASIPCGLIINEIISNSLKYAFPDNRDGIIFVTLRVIKKMVKIEVGDNGVGIPESVDVKQTQTLGLQLVDTLVEQLNGTLNLKRKNGTTFSIEFNI